MKNIEILPATKQIIEDFLQQVPELTQKTLAVKENNEIIALVGLTLHHTRWVLFSYIRPDIDLREHKRAVILATRKILSLTKGLPIHAMADPNRDGSDRLLEHLGFIHKERGLYVWQPPLLHS